MENRRTLEEQKIIKKSVCIIAIAAVLLLCAAWLLPTDSRLSLAVEYSREFDNDYNAQLFWNTGDGYNEAESSYKKVERNRAEFEIRESAQSVQELRFDPADKCEEIAITSVQVKKFGVGVQMIPVREILNRAQFYSINNTEVTRGVLSITSEDTDPAIILKLDMVNDYIRSSDLKFKLIISIWICMTAVLAAVASIELRHLKKIFKYIAERYYEITVVILLIGLFIIGYMAFNSFDYAHPDENMSKSAVDYYMNHWKPADIRSDEAADSFSAYGNSRLGETTVYYFLAGKVAWIAQKVFGIDKYYRAFNVMLFALMVGIYCIKGRKNGFLFIMLGLTPQIWYIFSYTTSDAWDYFLGFLILYQLTVKESMLNRALKEGFSKRTIAALGIAGLMFGTLFLGKKNYYFIFAAAFILLLYRWIFSLKNQKVQILIKYGTIVTICMMVFCGVKYADALKYDGNKAEIAFERKQFYAEKEETTDENAAPQGIWAGVRMRDQGITLKQIFSKYNFAGDSYRSYTGVYGWMEYVSPYLYYIIMGILYLFILFVLINVMIKGKNNSVKILTSLLLMLNIAIFWTSVWHAWVSDFQPQGRYLFAINFIMAICFYIYDKYLFAINSIKLSLCLCGGLSIYSFIFSGILNLT